MPYDGLYMRRVVDEINEKIEGPLRNIYQPTKVDYYLYFQNGTIRVSLNPTWAFMALTEKMKNPSKMPPSFTMLLRKYLKNSRFLGVNQEGFSRVAVFKFERLDEKGDLRIFSLFVELMGKYSNMILVSDEGVVVDAHRRITTRMGRELFPGRKFVPFKGEKLDPMKASFEEILRNPEDVSVERFLTKRLEGLSRILAREIVYRAGFTLSFSAKDLAEKQLESLYKAIMDFREEYSLRKCYLLLEESSPSDISPVVLHHLSLRHQSHSPSEAVMRLVLGKEREDFIKNKRRDFEKVVVKKIDKLEDVARKIRGGIEGVKDFEGFKKKGELLLVNAYGLNASSGVVEVKDWESGDVVKIDVDPRLDALQNAQRYFEKYKKLKRKSEGMKKRLKEVEKELEYLYQLWQTILDADDEKVFEEIEEELRSVGILKSQKRRKRKESPRSSPRKVFYKGFTILVGKNNRQNDELVRRSSPNDVWLHARQIPGAHVVIKTEGKKVPEDVLVYAASLAAGYSRGRNSGNVPVDHTLVKYVKKPKGFKPGMVIYRNQKTLIVTPKRLD